ncbi:uridine kinase [Cellulomonas cellasea]|uniref:Uridine kinase n=1 Tax=Cellulomonas cellasea TaxID=43670 RepID=A0A7W4UIL0_9CELL|nr:uridine kinase [Cellulomonas cellasea]MBB2924840.1 uridine kinase [Cellulomonas cellasea]
MGDAPTGREPDDALGAVLRLLRAAVPARGRALVAIDGIGGSGKSTFAADLARRVDDRPVVVLHADDFLHPSATRHARGRLSPEGFWLDAYDYPALTAGALEPLRRGGDGLYRTHALDHAADRRVRPDPVRAPDDALVLVEGTFLHRDELVGFWDFSVYLDVALAEGSRRLGLRDGVDPRPGHGPLRRYTEAQRLYFAAASPWERASVVVDTTDVRHPRVVEPTAVAALR